MPAIPRDAATIVLTRPGSDALEILLTQRPATMKFAAGLHVFPGGAVDREDHDVDLVRRSVLTPDEARAAFGEARPGVECLAFYLAAVREMFEEAGVLLAERTEGRAIDAELLDLREAVARGDLPWREFCARFDLRLRTDLLVYLCRWITPTSLPRRFDTRFFAAPLPEGQKASGDDREVERLAWMPPRAALDAMASGQIQMWLPTSTTLQHLADARDFAEIRSGLAGGAPGAVTLEDHSALVRRVLCPNPGVLTGPGTNTYLVGHREIAVIDPGVQDDTLLDTIEETVRALDGKISCILLTHIHPDHIGGAEDLGDRNQAPILCGPGGSSYLPFEARELADGEVIELDGATLVAHHMPGHATEHVCYRLNEEQAVFSGDLIVGQGTVMIAPPDGDMKLYLRSLRALDALGPGRIYPGHHPPIENPQAQIASLITHRNERTEKVVRALREEPRELDDLLVEVYDDVGEELLPFARGSLEATLLMLEEENRARRRGHRWGTARRPD